MLSRLLVAVAIVALAFTGNTFSSASMRAPSTSLVLHGQVVIKAGVDGRTAVLVDTDPSGQAADGVVDYAFRLQQAPPVSFSGTATVVYSPNRVTVAVDQYRGWVFTVAGREAPPTQDDALYDHYSVVGLSRFWGPSVAADATTVATQLLGTSCADSLAAQSSSQPGCDSCQTGGPGTTGCSVGCEGGTCIAECPDDYYACCNCPLGCGCCPRNPGRSVH